MPLRMRSPIDSRPPYASPFNRPSVKKPRQDLIPPTTTIVIEFYHDRVPLGPPVNIKSEVSPSDLGVSEPGLDTQGDYHNTRHLAPSSKLLFHTLQLMGAFYIHQNVTGAIVAKGFDTVKG